MIAREIEARGIATVCLSSALSITRSVNPPRAVFTDFPLGHTAGPPHDRPLQRRIMIDTLSALDGIQVPGDVRHLPYLWPADPAWKRHLATPAAGGAGDDRTTRRDSPQYERPEDEAAAAAEMARNGCPSCVFVD